MLVGVKIYRSAVFSEGLLKSVRRRFTFLPCAIASYRRLGGAHGGRRTARSTADGRETFAMTFVVVCDGFDCFGVGERRFLLDWVTKSANSSKCAEGTVLTVAVIMQPSTAASGNSYLIVTKSLPLKRRFSSIRGLSTSSPSSAANSGLDYLRHKKFHSILFISCSSDRNCSY